MQRRFQLFYWARDKSKELHVMIPANSFKEAQIFFEKHFVGFDMTRILEVKACPTQS